MAAQEHFEVAQIWEYPLWYKLAVPVFTVLFILMAVYSYHCFSGWRQLIPLFLTGLFLWGCFDVFVRKVVLTSSYIEQQFFIGIKKRWMLQQIIYIRISDSVSRPALNLSRKDGAWFEVRTPMERKRQIANALVQNLRKQGVKFVLEANGRQVAA